MKKGENRKNQAADKKEESEIKKCERKRKGGARHKNQLFLGSSRQHTQTARVTLTADAILTFRLSFFKSCSLIPALHATHAGCFS